MVGNRDYIWENFVFYYQWMMEQMKKHMTEYEGEYPIWIWTKRQDLRHSAYLQPGEHGVQLELSISDNKVLLSDFQAWHIVLNDGSILIDDEEVISKEKSWERIFDFDFLQNRLDWGELDLQGVTGKILLKNIKLVKEFVCR